MNYNLKVTNDKVLALHRAGKDLVKIEIPAISARLIISQGEMKKSDVGGYPININDKWYFEGEAIPSKKLTLEKTLTKSGGKK